MCVCVCVCVCVGVCVCLCLCVEMRACARVSTWKDIVTSGLRTFETERLRNRVRVKRVTRFLLDLPQINTYVVHVIETVNRECMYACI